MLLFFTRRYLYPTAYSYLLLLCFLKESADVVCWHLVVHHHELRMFDLRRYCTNPVLSKPTSKLLHPIQCCQVKYNSVLADKCCCCAQLACLSSGCAGPCGLYFFRNHRSWLAQFQRANPTRRPRRLRSPEVPTALPRDELHAASMFPYHRDLSYSRDRVFPGPWRRLHMIARGTTGDVYSCTTSVHGAVTFLPDLGHLPCSPFPSPCPIPYSSPIMRVQTKVACSCAVRVLYGN